MEHIGNLKGTCWEQMKNEQNLPPPQNLKEKKSRGGFYLFMYIKGTFTLDVKSVLNENLGGILGVTQC